MAVTITQVGRSRQGLRGASEKAFAINCDASKPAGGYTVLASALGFTYLDFGQVQTPDPLYSVKFEIDSASTKGTMQFYAATESAASLLGSAIGASATGVSVKPVAALFIGRL